jgi:hypothetical protein
MAGSTTSNDGDFLSLAGRIWAAENYLVFGVKSKGRVGESDGIKCGHDQMGRVCEEVLGF